MRLNKAGMTKHEGKQFDRNLEIKNIKNIDNYFELDPKGNWENKTILVEKKNTPQGNH